MPYERLNMLILTDYTDNASRILDIIHMLDNSYLDPDLVELVRSIIIHPRMLPRI